MNIFFSVIIPIYNAEKTLEATLNSVLDQTYKHYEVILINDCSNDNSSKIINQYKHKFSKINIINNVTNIGVANSRNKGALISNGDYIAFLDSDDVWMNDKLEKQKQIIIDTNCDVCCTSYSFIDEFSQDIKSDYIVPEKITYKMLLKENYVGCSSVIIKREVFLENKMSDTYFHEDFALWLNLTRNNTPILGTDQVLMKYRIMSNSRSFNKLKAAKNRYEIYRKQEELNIFQSLYYLSCYIINGFRKKMLYKTR